MLSTRWRRCRYTIHWVLSSNQHQDHEKHQNVKNVNIRPKLRQVSYLMINWIRFTQYCLRLNSKNSIGRLSIIRHYDFLKSHINVSFQFLKKIASKNSTTRGNLRAFNSPVCLKSHPSSYCRQGQTGIVRRSSSNGLKCMNINYFHINNQIIASLSLNSFVTEDNKVLRNILWHHHDFL